MTDDLTPEEQYDRLRRRVLPLLVAEVNPHIVRHLAQVAHAARAAGIEPPGEHDLLFCPVYD